MISTKREVIESFRKKLQEQNADSTFSNKFLYQTLMEHAKWLIKREISSGRIYRNNSFFQTLRCQEVIEESSIDCCCPIKTNCKVFRTKNKLPDAWIDNDGPVLKNPTSVDGSTEFFIISAQDWLAKKSNPYTKMGKAKYAFVSDNYLFFPEHNPHRINIPGFYTDDIALIKNDCEECQDNEQPCLKFLDTKFALPDWLFAELFSKSMEQLLNTKRIPEDEKIDKDVSRK